MQVLAGKSFTFETSTVKVRPFETKKVKFTVSPQNANLTWTTSQTDEFFTHNGVSAMAVDKDGNGYVEISGQKEGSGNLYCVTDGGAKGNLSVKVSWDYEFNANIHKISASPDKTQTVLYTVNPVSATIDYIADDTLCKVSVSDDGFGNGTVVVTPLREGSGTLVLTADNPDDFNKRFGYKEIPLNFEYSSLTPAIEVDSVVSYTDNTKEACWSKYNGTQIYLGDGEKMTFSVSVKEQKVSDLELSYSFNNTNSEISLSQDEKGRFVLSHNNDVTEPCYQIITGYRPTYKGSTSYPDGTEIKLADFYSDRWGDCWFLGPHSLTNPRKFDRILEYIVKNPKTSSELYRLTTGRAHHCGNVIDRTIKDKVSIHSDWGRIRDTSLDGKCYSVEEFQSYLWYYVPYFQLDDDDTCPVHLRHPYGQIDTDHIDAVYCDATPDTAIVSTVTVGSIMFTLKHNGKEQKISIPISLETRNSVCTQK